MAVAQARLSIYLLSGELSLLVFCVCRPSSLPFVMTVAHLLGTSRRWQLKAKANRNEVRLEKPSKGSTHIESIASLGSRFQRGIYYYYQL